MSAPPSPADPTPRPRRARRGGGDGETFGSFTPWQNPAAVYAYAVSLAGMVPVVGVLLGPVAILLGTIGVLRYRRRPAAEGLNFAVAGIVLGALDMLFNAAGLWCIGRGVGWW